MAVQNDNTILNKGDLKAYHERILPYLGGNMMVSTNNSDYYSNEEKVVGVWTDGRPVYERTLVLGAMTAQRTDYSFSNYGLSNVEMAWIKCAAMHHTTGGWWLSDGFYQLASDFLSIAAFPNHVRVNSPSYSGYTEGWATIQYVKTTDTAGSATTTPGAYDINFPNTWPVNTEIYFGNGVYGKRFTGSVTASSTWQDVLKQLDSVDRGASFQFIATGGSIRRRGGDTCMSLGHQDTLEYELWYASSVSGQPSGIRLRGKDNSNTPVDYDLWCTYTK